MGIGSHGQKGLFPGKASPKMSGGWVTVGDKEVKVDVSDSACLRDHLRNERTHG